MGKGDDHDIKCTLGCGSDLHVGSSGLQQDRTDRSTARTRAHHCRDSSTGRKRGYHSASINDCIHHSLSEVRHGYTESAFNFRTAGLNDDFVPRLVCALPLKASTSARYLKIVLGHAAI